MKLKYYARNLVGSFIGLCALTGIVKTIFQYTAQSYETIGTIFGITTMLLGLLFVGYTNTAISSDNKVQNTVYVHLILVFLLFITDIIFGASSLLGLILRNIGYFIALQLGVYLYMKRNSQKLHLISKN